jgi:hypothetical protein
MKNPRIFKIETLLWKYKQVAEFIKTLQPGDKFNRVLDQFLDIEKEIEIQAAYLSHEGELL